MKYHQLPIQKLKITFAEALPFKHVAIPNFLALEDLRSLIEAVSTQEFTYRSTDIYSFWQSSDFKMNTEHVLSKFRDLMRNEVVNDIINITGFFLHAGEIDMHATMYRDTDHLLCYDDQLEGRKVAYMLYLSSLAAGEGGALELYASEEGEPTTVVRRLVPLANTLLIFEVSSLSFHAVSELLVNKDRLAIAGWFHGTD